MSHPGSRECCHRGQGDAEAPRRSDVISFGFMLGGIAGAEVLIVVFGELSHGSTLSWTE